MDPDPSFHFNADLDPDTTFSLIRIRIRILILIKVIGICDHWSIKLLHGSILSLHPSKGSDQNTPELSLITYQHENGLYSLIFCTFCTTHISKPNGLVT